MAKILVSFLGKPIGKLNEKEKDRYSRANYGFPEENDPPKPPVIEKDTPYFGIKLAERKEVNTLRILGTKGSMWDVLLKDHCNETDTTNHSDFLETLAKAVDNNAVDQSLLDQTTYILKNKFSFKFELRLIEYGLDEENAKENQINIIEKIAENLNKKDSILLDVTHGLRHLAMLGLLASFYLSTVKGLTIEGIWYGAYDRREKNAEDIVVTPVVRLDGLLEFLDWTKALSNFNKDGDYSVVAKRLVDNKGRADYLKQAAFYERIAHPVQARDLLEHFFISGETNTTQSKPNQPLEDMFLRVFKKSSDWREHDKRHQWEGKLARHYFERGDYLRAVLFTQEAIVTKISETKSKMEISKLMDEAIKEHGENSNISKSIEKAINYLQNNRLDITTHHGIREGISKSLQGIHEEFKRLSKLRNHVAHGFRENGKEMFKDREDLENIIQVNLDKHFPPETSSFTEPGMPSL